MKAILLLSFFSFSAMAWISEPVGNYNRGSLINGECLPSSGIGYTVLQLTRDVGHIFGTTEMIDMLEATAAEMENRYPGRDRMQVEDLSAREGGDIDPHGSHENGLDVDIGYFKNDGQEYVPTRSDPYAPPMVLANGTLSPNFDVARNWEFVKALHRHGNVQAIFIDTKLKAALVAHARSKGETTKYARVISTMVHVENHQDHLHVRLNCPSYARQCRSTNAR